MKMRVEQSIIVNLSAEEIFAYIADFENLVEWASPVIAVRKTPSGETCVGAILHCVTRFLGKWVEITYEVVECEPHHHITLKSISGVASCVLCYLFEPVEDGRTRVSQESVFQLTGGLIGLTESVVTSAARRQLEYDMLTLKDMLEARVAST